MVNKKDKYIQISKATELKTVLRISRAVSRTLDLDEILEMSCRMTAQALKADRCSIGLLNPAEDAQEIVRTYRRKLSYPSIDGISFKVIQLPHISQKLMRGKIAQLFSTQKSQLNFYEQKLFQKLSIKVFLAVPIVVDRKPLGAFHLARVENFTPFSPLDINLCQTIANQVGIAIKNANLLKDIKNKYDQQNIILNISKSLFQTLNLQELFNLITQKTCEVLKMERCSISTIDSEKKQGIIRSIYSSTGNSRYDSSYLGRKFSIVDFRYISKQVKKNGLFVTEDILSTPLTPRERKYFLKAKVKSTLLTPLFSERKVTGFLHVSSLEECHHFTDSEIKLCQTIANLASLALKNVELMQNLQEKSTKIQQQAYSLEKQYREQSILLEISKALSQTLDLNKLFEIVTKKTTELLGVEHCAIALLDEIEQVSVLTKIYSNERHRSEYESIRIRTKDFSVLAKQLKKKQIFWTSDILRSILSSKEKNFIKKRGIKSLLIIPFNPAGKLVGEFVLSTLTKQHDFTESEIRLSQAIANQLSVVIEKAQLMQNLQEKSTKIQQQAYSLEKQYREQSILLEISKALSQTLDLNKLFEIVTQKTAELLGIDRCAVALVDKIKGIPFKLKVYFNGRFSPEYENMDFSTRDFQGLYHHLKNKHIFCSSNIPQSSLSLNEIRYFKNEGTKSLLVIPFNLVGKIEGYIALSNLKEKHTFTESEIKLSQAIVNQLSMAIENAQLMDLSKKHSKELEKLSLQIINAQEDERKILAGKLHDVIAQDLTAIKFDLKMCQHTLPDQYTLIRDKLEECEKLATQSLENLRNLTSDLRPPILDHFGLVSTIRWYIDSFKLRTNLKIKVKIPKLTYKFPPEFETTIYRIIQEGLTNVAKHSQAERASISLYKKGNNVRIIIQDNGIGFELENLPHVHGFGLFRMKENTELLGGKFKIISNKGRGTKLDIALPCEEKN